MSGQRRNFLYYPDRTKKAEVKIPSCLHLNLTPDSALASVSSLTPDRVKELKQNDEIVQLLYITEQYLGKTLTPTEVKKIMFFYDELHFSPDLIEYLIEYSVSRGHKSIRYIETVALAWAKEGISTVTMAKETNSQYNREILHHPESYGDQRPKSCRK